MQRILNNDGFFKFKKIFAKLKSNVCMLHCNISKVTLMLVTDVRDQIRW